MIGSDGYLKYCIWEHSSTVKELYTKRCTLEAEEMTSCAQAAELLAPLVKNGDTLLDAGCGSGYFFHSLKKKNLGVTYHGIDAAPSLIAIGKTHMVKHGLKAEQLQVLRIEDLDGSVDHIVCLNVLSNIDNYHRPLERLLRCARKSVIVRESCHDKPSYQYVKDKYLDPDVDLKVHVNAYPLGEFGDFIRSYGFDLDIVADRRTGGEPEMIIDYPHYWKFFVAKKRAASS